MKAQPQHSLTADARRKLACGSVGVVALIAVLSPVFHKQQPVPTVGAFPTADPGERQFSAHETILSRLKTAGAADDPWKAAAAIAALAEDERMPFAMELASAWGRRDFGAARRWALAQGNEELLEPLGRAGIATQPLEAMALADSLSNDESRLRFLTMMIQEWVAVDSTAAVEWVNGCGHSAKALIQAALAIQLAQKDPVIAARYVALDMEPGDAQDQAALTVAARWAYIDPKAAEAWARSLPESDLQQRVLTAVASLSAQ